MSLRTITEALGVTESALSFLSVHTDEQLGTLAAAITGALHTSEAPDALSLAAMLTGSDPSTWASAIALLHAAADPELWEQITGECGLTERGAFVSERYQVTYGLFQAWCENPFSPPQAVYFDLSTTNQELLDHLPPADRLAALAPLASAASLRLSIWCRDITDIAALTALTNLTSLNLYGSETITDLSPLARLPQLECLDLGSLTGIQAFDFLRALTNLKLLKLHKAAHLTSLDCLSAHPALQVLSLSYCAALEDLDGLDACVGLQTLSLSECKALSGLSGLIHCADLRAVNIKNCQKITSLSSLTGCAELEKLHTNGLNLTSLDGLQNKPRLTTARLSYSCARLTSIDGLAGCTGLETLYINGLSRASVSDLSALSGATALTALTISSAQSLQDISGLAGCTALTELDLAESGISDVDALTRCTALTRLNLERASQLKSITGLVSCTALTSLRLRGCRMLAQVDGLEALSSLERLDLRNWGGRDSALYGLAIPPDDSHLQDRSAVKTYQDKIALVLAIQHGDQAVVLRHRELTTLNLAGCRMLTNPRLLQLLTNLTVLDLRRCDGLHYKIWRKNFDTPEKIAGFYRRLSKRLPLED